MRPSQTFHVLEMLTDFPSAPLRRKGFDLNIEDNQTVLEVYQQWLLLMIDLDYLHPDTLKRTLRRLWIDIIQVDVYELNDVLAECAQLIRLRTNKGFKALCGRISSHFYHLVKSDMESVLQGDVLAAKRLMQLFCYTSRLSLRHIDLTPQLLMDYLETEDNIPDSFDPEITNALNKIIKRWFSPFVPDGFFPRHGPGGVAGLGRCSLEAKYHNFAVDGLINYIACDYPLLLDEKSPRLKRISQTIFVPKSYKTFRTISMEPATLQYLQQGVLREIDHCVTNNRYLRNRLGTHDAERNALLAKEGSLSRNFATIDLSAASDSVSYQLVKKVFRGTWLLRYLVALRSTSTLLPDARVIELKKFAPMGSALCFPVETLLFASICEMVTRKHHVNGRYSVYGDDIIIPTQCAQDVITVLEQLGFRTNSEKSFIDRDCWFRESCGGHYVSGFDITPLRVSRRYCSTLKMMGIADLTDLANAAYKRDFMNLRYFFIKKQQRANLKVIFGSDHLLTNQPTNFHLKSRWNSYLQRLEVRAHCLIARYPREEVLSQDELIRFRHWIETTRERTSLECDFESIVCRNAVTIKEKWIMKPYHDIDQIMVDSKITLKE